ncbi:MAG: acyltransferase [Rhodocyclaceae bacterium]|nr:MAG: acyltransferase [Rhodocyclaceae bacterium]
MNLRSENEFSDTQPMNAVAPTPSHSNVEATLNARVRHIDLFRFIAAFMVMLFHYTFRGYAADGYSPMPYPWLAPVTQYGYLGVEFFFLISGFVILMTASSGSLRRFMVSRVTRLYPAFWFCCTLTFIAILVFGTHRFVVTPVQYLVNLTMLNEFVGVEPIDGVYWSLAVEIRFYLLIGVLLLIGRIHRADIFLTAWLILTVALDLFPVEKLKTLFITFYAPYFIAGAASYLIYAKGKSPKRLALFAACWVLALAHSTQSTADLIRHYHANYNVYVPFAIISVFFVAFLVVAIVKPEGKMNWVTVGNLTYPLYLIHQVIGYLVFSHGYPGLNPHLLLWGTVFAMLLIAYFINQQVEKPLARRLRRLLAGSGPELA